jgi:hypothetical protein
MTRGYSRRVKGHRTKQRQDVPRVEVAGPCEDTLEACTTRGVTVMPFVKRVKPFVRNGKGVIEVDDHTQGPPINSDPLCNRTDTH